MIPIKSPQDVIKMQEGGKILASTIEKVIEALKPGVSELDLENIAVAEIIKGGGKPSFKMVPGYKHALCLATNDAIVHGIPGQYHFKEGDVVGIDCGVFYKGFHTDMSESAIVGSIDKETEKFLTIGKKALLEAIAEAKVGNRIGHISKKIQDIVEGSGYSVVRTLIGHGVGEELHEEPEVPGFLDRKIEQTPLLKEGMTLAIEVIYNMGGKETKYDQDGWTIRTKDGKVSGLFERTVAITNDGPVILTQ
jgi:methionyl aminopeptidase